MSPAIKNPSLIAINLYFMKIKLLQTSILMYIIDGDINFNTKELLNYSSLLMAL